MAIDYKDNRSAEEILDNVKRYLKILNKIEKNSEVKRIIKEVAYIIAPTKFVDPEFDSYMLERLLK
jgi:hypothetical protein